MFKLNKQLLMGIAAIGISTMGIVGYSSVAFSNDYSPPTAEQRAKFAAHMQQREAKLHDELKLTPAQEGAWKTFTDQEKSMFDKSAMHHPDKQDMAKMTAPERMDQRMEFMKKMQERMAEQSANLKKFYAVLTPEQQKIMDQHFSHEQHEHFGHHGDAPGMGNGPTNGTKN
ncbi:Spy/CpxP family protein refolding chaperone [Sulfuriferula nivalis]|uniref:LTXXQ motif family protein n=1 Tax=Sulfuriferula nivalis TaxID=2675298 RepID=A0A809RH80_9PROT|nr:Spy/CpxP family protein refolding chaperone [Sulfuriferula nivalis]BBP00204.1 hypothetical protein SFSGTM_09120 [Sulfuriferula nivalis]